MKADHELRVSHSVADGEQLGGQEQGRPSLFLNHKSPMSYIKGKETDRSWSPNVMKVSNIPEMVPGPPASLVSFTPRKAIKMAMFTCYR